MAYSATPSRNEVCRRSVDPLSALNSTSTFPMYIPHGYTETGNGTLDRLCQQSKPGCAAPQGSGVSRGGAPGRGHLPRQQPVDYAGWPALGRVLCQGTPGLRRFHDRAQSASGRGAPAPLMLEYMLDTNICVYVIKNRPAALRERFDELAEGLCISTITLAELLYGVEKSARRSQNLEAVKQFAARLEVLPFSAKA